MLQVCIQSEDVKEGRNVLEKLQEMRPDDEELRNDGARLNRLESAMSLKAGASTLEGVQKELQAAVTAQDKPACTDLLKKLEEMFSNGEVKYDDVKKLKV